MATTSVFLPRRFHGQMSTVGCSSWGHKCLDTIDHACMLLTFFWMYFFLSTLFFLLISEWLSICFFNIYIYLFISLNWVLVVAHGILSFLCIMGTLSCSMWDLIPQPGIKPRPPALAAWSLSHWTTAEVPAYILLIVKPSSLALLEI